MDINIPQEWIPVFSGAFGAGGAVLAQVVAASATARREKRSLAAVRANTRAAAFADQKRELFVKVIAAVDRTREDYDTLLKKLADGDTGISMPTGVLDHKRLKGWNSEFDLLAPDVARAANECFQALVSLDTAVAVAYDEDSLRGAKREVAEKRAAMRDAMRVSLNVADPPKVGRITRAKAAWDARQKGTAAEKAEGKGTRS